MGGVFSPQPEHHRLSRARRSGMQQRSGASGIVQFSQRSVASSGQKHTDHMAIISSSAALPQRSWEGQRNNQGTSHCLRQWSPFPGRSKATAFYISFTRSSDPVGQDSRVLQHAARGFVIFRICSRDFRSVFAVTSCSQDHEAALRPHHKLRHFFSEIVSPFYGIGKQAVHLSLRSSRQ